MATALTTTNDDAPGQLAPQASGQASAPPAPGINAGPAVSRGSLFRLLGPAALLASSLTALRASLASAAGSRSGLQAPFATERGKVAHLLRRAGFGYTPDELDRFTGMGAAATLEYLLNYEAVEDDAEARIAGYKLNLYNNGDLQRWWLLRMIFTRRPLQEKMTLFWHGLLVSGTGKVGINQPKPEAPTPPNLILNQNSFFREHALDSFSTIIKGISRDPAMVIYLDNRDNRKGKPNENYARELMELFTLGVTGPDGQPSYTEQDIREVARSFTGWGLNREQQFAFNSGQHDNANKTVFGKTGNLNGDDVIDLIVARPSGAYYITRRLFEFFVYDGPDAATLAPFVQTFKSSNGSIRSTVQAILSSPVFHSEQAYRAKAKSPVEYLASMSKSLNLDTDAFGFQSSAQRMGQTLFNPPNVAGWPGGAQWFNTSTWLERVNQLNRTLTIRKDTHTQPVNYLGIVQKNGLDTPEKVADHFLNLLVDGQIRPEQRQVLVAYLKQDVKWPAAGAAIKETDPIVDRKVRGLVYLVMAMPEFQLA